MSSQIGEITIAYATRLWEKAHDCDFGTNNDERILEHLNDIDAEMYLKGVDFTRVSYRKPGKSKPFLSK